MNKYFPYIKMTLALTIVLLGASYTYAAFSVPGSGAPNNNLAIPVHTGYDQIKDGSLSVNTFAVNGNAAFDGAPTSVFFKGIIRGDSPFGITIPTTAQLLAYLQDGGTSTAPVGGRSTVSIGGQVGLGSNGTYYRTSIVTSDSIVTKRNFIATTLANGFFNVDRSKSELCADQNGIVILCNIGDTQPAFDVCSNIQGTQTTTPDGMSATDAGTCVFAGAQPTSDDYCPNIPGAQTSMSGFYYDGLTNEVLSNTNPYVFGSAYYQVLTDINSMYTTYNGMNFPSSVRDSLALVASRLNVITTLNSPNSIGVATQNIKSLESALSTLATSFYQTSGYSSAEYFNVTTLRSRLVASYRDGSQVSQTALSYDSAWNCKPIPRMISATYEYQVIGPITCSVGCRGNIKTTLKLTFDNPLLATQTFDLAAFLDDSFSNNSAGRKRLTITGLEGQTVVTGTSGVMPTLFSGQIPRGQDYQTFDAICLRPEVLAPIGPGIPGQGAEIPLPYKRWTVRSGTAIIPTYTDNTDYATDWNCANNPLPTDSLDRDP